MPHQEIAVLEHNAKQPPPGVSDLLERDPTHRLEFQSRARKPYLFFAASDTEARIHVAEYLEISYPLVQGEFEFEGGRGIYREGSSSPIYPRLQN